MVLVMVLFMSGWIDSTIALSSLQRNSSTDLRLMIHIAMGLDFPI
jgi:hypothetical protein